MAFVPPRTPKDDLRNKRVTFAQALVRSVRKENHSNKDGNESAFSLNMENFDFRYIHDAEYVEDYIKSIDSELERSLKNQEDEYMEDVRKMKVYYTNAMMKIPKTVKNMKLVDYNQDYEKDILAEITSASDNKSVTNRTENFQTPQRSFRNQNDSATTAIKTVQRNQRIYNSDGSPVQLCEEGEMTATCRKEGRMEEITFGINIGNGEILEIESANDLKMLDEKYRSLAIEKFQKYQERVNSILDSIKI